MDSLPTFERTASKTIQRATGIYADRGENYGDSWALENQTRALTDATLLRLGIPKLDSEQMRLLQLAVLSDVKDQRLIGRWNPDSIDDGLNYRAAWCTLRDEYEQRKARSDMRCNDL